MPTPPPAMLPLLAPFAPHFSRRVWPHALVLAVGAVLAPGRRTVAAALRAMGLDRRAGFERYHRVLNRDRWSGLAVGRTLLGLLVAAFVPDGPLVVGIDETVERRRGAKIAAKGIYRDAVRSSRAHFVKASGRRWVCVMLLVPIPWAGRTWALPVLTALAPSERYDREHGRRHKALTDWAGQLLLVVRRWWPDRPHRRGRRRHLRRPGVPGPVPRLAHPGHGRHAPAARRGPLRAGPAAATGADRATPAQGAAAADARGPRGRPRDRVGAGHRRHLVWAGASAPSRSRRARRSGTTRGQPLVPLRWVLVRDPAGRIRPPSAALHRPDGQPRTDPGLVRAALAARGHV